VQFILVIIDLLLSSASVLVISQACQLYAAFLKKMRTINTKYVAELCGNRPQLHIRINLTSYVYSCRFTTDHPLNAREGCAIT